MLNKKRASLLLAAGLGLALPLAAGNPVSAFAEEGAGDAAEERDPEVQAQLDRAAALLVKAQAELSADEDPEPYIAYEKTHTTLVKGMSENPDTTAEKAKASVDALEKRLEQAKKKALEKAQTLLDAAVDKAKEKASSDEVKAKLEEQKAPLKETVAKENTYTTQRQSAQSQSLGLYNTLASAEKEAAIQALNAAYDELEKNNKPEEKHYSAEDLEKIKAIKDAALAELEKIDDKQDLLNDGKNAVDDAKVDALLQQIKDQLAKVEEMKAVEKSLEPNQEDPKKPEEKPADKPVDQPADKPADKPASSDSQVSNIGLILARLGSNAEAGSNQSKAAQVAQAKNSSQAKALPKTGDNSNAAGAAALLAAGLASIAVAYRLRKSF